MHMVPCRIYQTLCAHAAAIGCQHWRPRNGIFSLARFKRSPNGQLKFARAGFLAAGFASIRRRRFRRRELVERKAASAPVPTKTYLQTKVEETIVVHVSLIFGDGVGCVASQAVRAAFERAGICSTVVELGAIEKCVSADIRAHLQTLTGVASAPWVFVGGRYVGGRSDVLEAVASGRIKEQIREANDMQAKEFLREEREFEVVRSKQMWRRILPLPAYNVMRGRTTEPPNSSRYVNTLPAAGYFACKGCALPLYPARSKFESGSGWPSFAWCYHSEARGCHVGARRNRQPASELDEVHGVEVTFEIFCMRCNGHLGHVFYDSTSAHNQNGERHCVNGVALAYIDEDAGENVREEKLEILPKQRDASPSSAELQ